MLFCPIHLLDKKKKNTIKTDIRQYHSNANPQNHQQEIFDVLMKRQPLVEKDEMRNH